jgi:hypothetical protein
VKYAASLCCATQHGSHSNRNGHDVKPFLVRRTILGRPCRIKRLPHFRTVKITELAQIFLVQQGWRFRCCVAKVCGGVLRALFYIGAGLNEFFAEAGYSGVKISIEPPLSR